MNNTVKSKEENHFRIIKDILIIGLSAFISYETYFNLAPRRECSKLGKFGGSYKTTCEYTGLFGREEDSFLFAFIVAIIVVYYLSRRRKARQN